MGGSRRNAMTMILLEPIYRSLPLQALLGALVCALILAPARWRYRSLARRPRTDYAALSAYWWSCLWLAVFLGFVVAFLPGYVAPCAVAVLGLVLATSWWVGYVETPR